MPYEAHNPKFSQYVNLFRGSSLKISHLLWKIFADLIKVWLSSIFRSLRLMAYGFSISMHIPTYSKTYFTPKKLFQSCLYSSLSPSEDDLLCNERKETVFRMKHLLLNKQLCPLCDTWDQRDEFVCRFRSECLVKIIVRIVDF